MFYVLMGFVALVLVGGLLVLLARNAERQAREPRTGRAIGVRRGAFEGAGADGGTHWGAGSDGHGDSGGGCDSGGAGGGCD
jgi:hypothetical protein